MKHNLVLFLKQLIFPKNNLALFPKQLILPAILMSVWLVLPEINLKSIYSDQPLQQVSTLCKPKNLTGMRHQLLLTLRPKISSTITKPLSQISSLIKNANSFQSYTWTKLKDWPWCKQPSIWKEGSTLFLESLYTSRLVMFKKDIWLCFWKRSIEIQN